jgi:hypothetical protein
MATITLEYNERDKTARQMIEIILSLGLATRKKTGLEEALEDVKNGRLMTVHTPQKPKTK